MTYGVKDCYVKIVRGVYIEGEPLAEDVIVPICGEDRDLLIGTGYGAFATEQEYTDYIGS